MSVLFICKGNICRSPMAMALVHHMTDMSGEALSAISAGYHCWDSTWRDAHPFARRAIEKLCGSDLLADHLAIRWTRHMVKSCGLVVVAEEWMKLDFPHDKVMTMRELAGRTGDVEDPYGGDYSAFLECGVEIRELLHDGWNILTGTQERLA